MNMSGFESNHAGGGHENDFESIIEGAGLGDGVISPELHVPERCSTCPALRRLQAELFNAASRLQPWANRLMAARQRLDAAADKLAQLGNIAEAAQETADNMTQVCDGPVVTEGSGRQGTVVALVCGSDVVNQPGSTSLEEVYVIRE